jgi:hypothetical protein
MQDRDPERKQDGMPYVDQGRYEIILPCEPEDFVDFISGLLGKPQTLERWIEGPFELNRRGVSDAYHLVDQRIHQQNDATLVQFSIRVMYSDNSSVLLNSLADFEVYNEIRPLKSLGAVLSWSYLVKFRNKNVPEKQTIDMTFMTHERSFRVVKGVVLSHGFELSSNGISLRIQHTDRTWGVDLESLLTGFAQTLVRQESRLARLIQKRSGEIGLLAGSSLFISAIVGVYRTYSSFATSHSAAIKKLLTSTAATADQLARKIDFLLEIVSSGAWPRFSFAAICFVLLLGVLSIVLGTWIASKADQPALSFVLFTKSAEEARDKWLRKRHRDWFLFSLSVVIGILTGVSSNILFAYYFGKVTW